MVAIGQWGTETPLAWRSTQGEKPLWDQIDDPLIMRDIKTFGYQPGSRHRVEAVTTSARSSTAAITA